MLVFGYILCFNIKLSVQDWVVTKLSKKSKLMRQTAMVAVDCEMVLCEDGSEALVRVCVVDRDLQVHIQLLVQVWCINYETSGKLFS